MQRVLVGFVLLAAAGCFRDNPGYQLPSGDPGGPTTGPIAGPGPGGDGGASPTPHDLSSTPGVDLSVLPTPLADLSIPPDLASSTTPGSSVSCGMDSCVAPQLCCLGLGAPTCIDPGPLACVGGRKLACDGPEDCASGKFCCGSVLGAACQPFCPSQAQLCHTSTDCQDTTDHCCPTAFGYSLCAKHGC
jgi:hypothetical protein